MGGHQTKETGDSPMSMKEDYTPPKEMRLTKRQLPFDPRSPTDDIVRTPIFVDSVPTELQQLDPRSPTVGIDRTPIIVDSMSRELQQLDPRSPTVGIDRTPLTALMATEMPGAALVTGVEPMEESMSEDKTAPLCQPEDSSDSDMTTPNKPLPTLNLDQDSLGDIPHMDAEGDCSPLLPNAVQPPSCVPEPTPLQTNKTLPKKLFTETQPVPSKQTPVSRGLVARDANSPLNIVQNKQRRQLVKSLGRASQHASIDKENLAH